MERLVAAAYARYSSDAQREESIEIQLREVDALIARSGWAKGPEYVDRAMTGRNAERPAFKRCIDDGESGCYDVLVVYKTDRLARNIGISQDAKRRLFDAGVRIVSVREGELRDTPDGFLQAAMQDVMAEYYSRDLSVKVRAGMWDSAMKCRACGNHRFGWSVDDDDRYVVDEREARWVREMFSMYLSGRTMNEIRDHLNGNGVKTPRGKMWSTQGVAQLMADPACKGVYRFMGREVDGGMPAIVSAEDFDTVQRMREQRKNSKRRRRVNDYLLSGKAYCLRCGKPMCGTAGTSCTGRKYTYYGCVLKGGCGLRVDSRTVESKVMDTVVAMLEDDETIERLVADLTEIGEDAVDDTREWRAELAEIDARRGRYLDAIAEGVSISALKARIAECDERTAFLESLIEQHKAAIAMAPDEESVRAFLDTAREQAGSSDPLARLLASSFVDKVFIDRECAVISLRLTKDAVEFTFDQARSVKESELAGRMPVRIINGWWSTVDVTETGAKSVALAVKLQI